MVSSKPNSGGLPSFHYPTFQPPVPVPPPKMPPAGMMQQDVAGWVAAAAATQQQRIQQVYLLMLHATLTFFVALLQLSSDRDFFGTSLTFCVDDY